MLSFLSPVPRADGLYVLADTQPQSCGCGGPTDRFDNDVTVRRLSWTDLGGAGTTLYTVQGPRHFDSIVPTNDGGIYALGSENTKSPRALYHVTSGGAQQLRRFDPTEMYAVSPLPPFAG